MQTKEDLMTLGFSENESLLLLELMNNGGFSKEDYIDDDLCFDLSQYEYCEAKLTLKNAAVNKTLEEDYLITFDELQVNRTDNGYSLTGDAYYYSCEVDGAEEFFKLCIEFESVEYKSKSLKSRFNIFENGNAWESLSYYGSCIYEKIKRPDLTANEKEMALEPLLKEFYILDCWDIEFDNIKFDVLKAYLPMNKKLNKLFDNIEKCKNADKRYKEINKLFEFLSCEKYEDSWHNLLNLLNDSQSVYEENKPIISNALLNEHERIEEIMHENDYQGSYPYFEKITKIKGIHLTKNYNEMFFAGMEKAKVFINCEDYISDNSGNITFYIFTILDKSDKAKDKYSCFFAKKGKGYCKTEHMIYETDESGELHFLDNSEQLPYIVCKKAEFKKLSKEEKRICGMLKSKEEISFIILVWMIAGLLFGLFMTLGFMLIEYLAALFTGSISDFPQLFMETPWWMIFLFAWLGFGGIMSLLSIITD